MKHFLMTIAAMIALTGGASAAVFELNPYARGCLTATGSAGCTPSGTADGNYVTGNLLGTTRRSFFLFDLSGVSGTIVSANLAFLNNHTSAYGSADASEALGFFQISAGSLGKLETATADAGVYSDLGTGVNLGYPSLTAGMNGGDVAHDLLQLWLDALNGAGGGKIGFGANLITNSGARDEFVFGFSGGSTVKLTLVTDDGVAVPLPAGLPLLLGGLGGLVLVRRRRLSGGKIHG